MYNMGTVWSLEMIIVEYSIRVSNRIAVLATLLYEVLHNYGDRHNDYHYGGIQILIT